MASIAAKANSAVFNSRLLSDVAAKHAQRVYSLTNLHNFTAFSQRFFSVNSNNIPIHLFYLALETYML